MGKVCDGLSHDIGRGKTISGHMLRASVICRTQGANHLCAHAGARPMSVQHANTIGRKLETACLCIVICSTSRGWARCAYGLQPYPYKRWAAAKQVDPMSVFEPLEFVFRQEVAVILDGDVLRIELYRVTLAIVALKSVV